MLPVYRKLHARACAHTHTTAELVVLILKGMLGTMGKT